GSSFWQTERADPNAGELGSIPIPERIVITPWPSGSGKFVTPCLRMQAENFAPSAVPTFMASRNCSPGPTGGPFSPAPRSLGVVVVADGVVDEAARSATPGELPPPLQPAANSANGTIETTQARMTGRRQRMSSGSFCMRQVDEQ